MLDDGNNFAWRQKPSRQFTAAQARDQLGLSLQLSQAVYYSIDSYIYPIEIQYYIKCAEGLHFSAFHCFMKAGSRINGVSYTCSTYNITI